MGGDSPFPPYFPSSLKSSLAVSGILSLRLTNKHSITFYYKFTMPFYVILKLPKSKTLLHLFYICNKTKNKPNAFLGFKKVNLVVYVISCAAMT